MEQDYVQDFSREELLQESRLETAMEKGEKRKQLEIANKMLNDKDLSLEKISSFIGLTVEKLTKIKSNIN